METITIKSPIIDEPDKTYEIDPSDEKCPYCKSKLYFIIGFTTIASNINDMITFYCKKCDKLLKQGEVDPVDF